MTNPPKSEALFFLDDLLPAPAASLQPAKKPWKILMVDDDPDIHAMTLVLLKKVSFQGRGVEFLSAYSGQEARALLEQHSDIAVVLLDMVMETDTTGLAMVSFIRQELGNALCRIILRSGHPSGSGEKQVILDYEVSDYREKGDLTSTRLFTTVISALRTYGELSTLEDKRFAMKRLVENTSHLYRTSSPDELCQLALSFWINRHAVMARKEKDGFRVIAGVGRWRKKIGTLLNEEETSLDKESCAGYRWSLPNQEEFFFTVDLTKDGAMDEEFFQAFCICTRSALEHCCEHHS